MDVDSRERVNSVSRQRLKDLVEEVDPKQMLDDDAEELLAQLADDFIESVVTASSRLAKHRKSSSLEVKDVRLHLEHSWNLWIPGFGAEEQHHHTGRSTGSTSTESHKQRVAMIKKAKK